MTDLAACCTSCASPAREDVATLAIACTLGSADFPERLASIRDLAARALKSSRRNGLTLELTYNASALSEVQSLVTKEQDCCAFLNFDLQHDTGAVRLTIVAPETAKLAADELFAHFAPDLATVAA